jgi:hypothetical protein
MRFPALMALEKTISLSPSAALFFLNSSMSLSIIDIWLVCQNWTFFFNMQKICQQTFV